MSITLTGTFTRLDGEPATGTVKITPSRSPILDSTGKVIISGPQVFPLDKDGKLAVEIPASNDPDLGPPFTYTVEALLSHKPWKISKVWIPHGPSTIDISTIADYTPLPGEPTRTVTIPADGEDGQVLVWDGAGFSWDWPPAGPWERGHAPADGTPFHDLPNGRWYVPTGATATSLGLPEVAHGSLLIHRSRGTDTSGLAIFTTRNEPAREWSYIWGLGGAPSDGWQLTTPEPGRQVRLATTEDVFDDLENGDYHVAFESVAQALGLPVPAHGVLTIDRWGLNRVGLATYETREEPSQRWSYIWHNSGPGTGWKLTNPEPGRIVRLATVDDTFEELGTGDYQVAFADVAAALDLPVQTHGVLRIDRWGTGPAGVATYTTRTDPAEVWSYTWAPDGTPGTWHRVTAEPAPATAGVDYGIRHHYVRTRHEAQIGAPINVGTATPVAFVWDDYPNSMRDNGVIAAAEANEIPITFAVCSRTLDPEYADRLGGVGITWAEIDQWVQNGWVELANHGATHNAYRGEDEMYDEIVTGLAELQAHSPTKPITTWVMPDNSWPGLDEGRNADGWASYTGQLILGHHAYATGKDRVRADPAVPMTGVPVQGVSRLWVEATGWSQATRQGQITKHYGTNRGIILSAHAHNIGEPDRWTQSEMEAFFAWLADERDAGRIQLMFLSRWPWAVTTSA